MARVAKRKLVRAPDGQLQIVFVDLASGRVVNDLKGYNILGHDTNGQQVEVDAETGQIVNTKPKPKPKPKPAAQKMDETPYGSDNDYYGDRFFDAMEKDRFPSAPRTPTGVPTSVKSLVDQVSQPSSATASGRPLQSTPVRDITQTPNLQPSTDPDLPTREMAGVSYNMGPNRPNIPSGGIVDKVQDVVTDVLGPGYSVSLISGEEDEGEQYGSNRHQTGLAGDFDVLDPSGQRVTDEGTLKDVAQGMAARYNANIGIGPEYMGAGRMHIDTVDPSKFTAGQDAQWGSVGNQWAGDLGKAREMGLMPSSYYDVSNPPTPTFKADAQLGPNEANVTVAFDRFNDDEKDLMARTLAGEIDQRYTDLNSPEGYKEAMSILSTMENRATKYGTVMDAITADKQYSTWNTPQTADVANANYAQNKTMFDRLVGDYAANPENNLGYTSYYNPSIANPAWGQGMQNVATIGPHKFGSLPEYGGTNFNTGSGFGAYVQGPSTDNVTGTSGIGASANVSVLGSPGTRNDGFMSSQGSLSSNVGSGFGSGTSGSGGGSYGGSGRSYSSVGSSSGGSIGTGTGMSGTSGNIGKSRDDSYSGSYGGSSRSNESSGSRSGGSSGGGSVGSGFGSGSSGSGGGSYGGSGRSYDSSGSTSGGGRTSTSGNSGMTGTGGNPGRSDYA